MKKRALARYYVILFVLIFLILALTILLIKINYERYETLEGLPSLGLWAPADNLGPAFNISANDSAIERTNRVETPSDMEILRMVLRENWLSFIILLSIIILFVALVMIVFRIHNG